MIIMIIFIIRLDLKKHQIPQQLQTTAIPIIIKTKKRKKEKREKKEKA